MGTAMTNQSHESVNCNSEAYLVESLSDALGTVGITFEDDYYSWMVKTGNKG